MKTFNDYSDYKGRGLSSITRTKYKFLPLILGSCDGGNLVRVTTLPCWQWRVNGKLQEEDIKKSLILGAFFDLEEEVESCAPGVDDWPSLDSL